MISTYTAKYTRIPSGYMGQLVEWPEVITEARTLDKCRAMLEDALREMIQACRDEGVAPPLGRALLEQMPVEL
jgi:predicted RNase H-like HicB family nuclease